MYANTYEYPKWGEVLGWLIGLSSMIWVPAYAVYFLMTTKGTLKERLRKGITPVIKPRPDAVLHMKAKKAVEDLDVEMRLVVNHS